MPLGRSGHHFVSGVLHVLRQGPVMTSTNFGHGEKQPEIAPEQGFLCLLMPGTDHVQCINAVM
jgi:hypothetical protein